MRVSNLRLGITDCVANSASWSVQPPILGEPGARIGGGSDDGRSGVADCATTDASCSSTAWPARAGHRLWQHFMAHAKPLYVVSLADRSERLCVAHAA
jgi:hypothetical protein